MGERGGGRRTSSLEGAPPAFFSEEDKLFPSSSLSL